MPSSHRKESSHRIIRKDLKQWLGRFTKNRILSTRAKQVLSIACRQAVAGCCDLREVDESPLVAHSLGLQLASDFHDQKFVFLHHNQLKRN